MKTTLASRRFTKTEFESKRDWADHPISEYTCWSCGAATQVTRGALDSSLDRKGQPERQKFLDELRESCGWVWREDCDAVHPFACSGCGRLVLLGFEVREYNLTG